MSRRQCWGGGALGGAMLMTALLAGCGNRFATNCKASHTCPKKSASGGTTGTFEPVGGGTVVDAGGAGAEAGEASGGAEALGECAGDTDCDASDNGMRCIDSKCIPDNGPPSIVSVTPEDGAASVEPSSVIEIVASEPLDAATVTLENIKLLDRGAEVAGQLSYADNVITFTPEKPLGLHGGRGRMGGADSARGRQHQQCRL